LIQDQKYKIIYADPPWSYSDKSKHRGGAERHYRTMNPQAIAEEIRSIQTEENAVLCLWATSPLLPEALNVIQASGFKFKTVLFTWTKINKKSKTLFWGMGHTTRSNAEFCLLGVKGKGLKRESAAVLSARLEPIAQHSKKPDVFRDDIVKLWGDQARIEMFARSTFSGWSSHGDQCQSLEPVSLSV
jgi:N6-adenosine-specific RNA methylase IME4